jgi:hypothetical protein
LYRNNKVVCGFSKTSRLFAWDGREDFTLPSIIASVQIKSRAPTGNNLPVALTCQERQAIISRTWIALEAGGKESDAYRSADGCSQKPVALEAVLHEISTFKPDAILNLGDTVLGGADPTGTWWFALRSGEVAAVAPGT